MFLQKKKKKKKKKNSFAIINFNLFFAVKNRSYNALAEFSGSDNLLFNLLQLLKFERHCDKNIPDDSLYYLYHLTSTTGQNR